MTIGMSVAVGLVLGAVGAAVHLVVTRWRASLASRRGAVAALVTMPVGLAGVGALVFLAARVSPVAAWTAPLGIFAVRLAVLRRLGR